MRNYLFSASLFPLLAMAQAPPELGSPSIGINPLTGSVVLAAGSKIYFGTGRVGSYLFSPGTSMNQWSGQFWSYDPTANSWSAMPGWSAGGNGGLEGGCGFVLNGKLYVGGGNNNFSGGSSIFRVFDPAQNAWNTLGNLTGYPQSYLANSWCVGFAVGSKGYGLTTSGMLEYEPTTDMWSFLGMLPSGVSPNNTTMIGVASYAYACIPGNPQNFRRFDPTTNTWADLAAIPDAAASGPLYALAGKIYARSSVVWEYNIATNIWTQKGPFNGTSQFQYAVAVGNKGYVLTTSTCGGCGSTGSGLLEVYEHDVATDAWSYKRPLGSMARSGASAMVINGKVYVGGGHSACAYFNDWWEYDPATTLWAIKNKPKGGGIRVANGAFGYFLSGSSLWRYQPTTDTWLQRANYPGPSAQVGFALGTKIYFGGPALWEYDPAADQWTQRQTCPGITPSFAWSLGTKGYFGAIGTTLWEYDATANNWTQRPTCPVEGNAFSITHRGYAGPDGDGRFWFYEQLTGNWHPSSFILPNNPYAPLAGRTVFSLGTTILNGLGDVYHWGGTGPCPTYYSYLSTFTAVDGTPYDCIGVLNGVNLPGTACNDNEPSTGSDTWNTTCVCVGTPIVVRVAVKALLEGPAVVGSANMLDGLRASGLVPISEPYTALGYPFASGGGESTTVPVLTATGTNAIVDWVLLELRSSGSPAVRVASRAALIQRDGDVVDLDGVSPVSLSAANGNYYVAIRHRNHLGCMTASPLALSYANPASINFTLPATPTYGTNARKTSGDVMLLWAGDVSFNGQIKYTGTGNDRDLILLAVGSTNPNGSVIGYRREDTNMDGVTLYTGSGNDRDPVLVNVGSTTPNAVRLQQLP